MKTPDLTGRRVAILVTDGEQIEPTSPRSALEKAGAETFVVAPKGGHVQGFNHHDRGDRIDRNFVSSRKPDDLPAFNRAIVEIASELQGGKATKKDNRDSLDVRA